METISVQAVISAKDNGYSRAMQQAIAQSEALEKSSDRAGDSIKNIAAGTVVGKAVTKAFGMITSSIDSAISRLDTMNNYPKVMESLGYSSDAAQKSMDRLAQGIEGLPTTMDGIVGSAQMLTASLDDLGKGTETAVALNDMFLAGGQGAEAASRALTQYNQILAKGKVDQQSWNTMVEVAPGQMKQLAQELIGASASQKDLYEALQNGTVSMSAFNDAVIRLDQEGGTGFKSFHDQALAATGGIGTAITNLHSAVTKGVANVIDAINKAAEAAGLPTISAGLEAAKQGINNFFKVVADVAGKITSVVAPALKFLGENIDNVAVAVGSVVGGMAALKVIDTVKSKIEGLKSKIDGIKKSFQTYSDVVAKYGSVAKAREAAEESMTKAIEAQKNAEEAAQNVKKARTNLEKAQLTLDNARRAATIAGTNASEAKMMVDQAENGVIEAQQGLINAITISEGADAAAKDAEAVAAENATAAQQGLNAAMEANPLGMVIMLITATISALSMLAAAFGGLSEEEKKARDEQQAFLDSANETADTVHRAAASIEEQKQASADAAAKTSALVDEIAVLNEADKDDIASKGKLKAAVAKLNAQVDDLNLSYDEETGKLSETVDAVRDKVKAYQDLKNAEKVQEDYLAALEQETKLREDQIRLEEDLQKAKEGTLATQKKEMEWTDLGASIATAGISEQLRGIKNLAEGYNGVDEALKSNQQALEENAQMQNEYADEMAEIAAREAEAAKAEAEAVAAAQRAERDQRWQTVNALAQVMIAKQQELENALGTENLTLDMLTEKNQATVQELQGIWQGYVDKATDMFNTLSEESTISVDQMIANIEKNQQVIENWGNNMSALRDRFAALQLDTAILDQLQELGPEGAGHVAALVAASDEQLQTLSADFSNGGKVAVEALGNSLSDGAAANLENVKGLVTDVKDSLSAELESANFAEIGDNILDALGTSLGYDEKVISAAKQVATNLDENFKNVLEMHSPSRVFEGHGENINAGLAQGVKGQSSRQPVNAIRSVGQQIINAARTALAPMQSVAMYGMQGFVNGLNAMAGSVRATAASIANSVKATIQSALQIHSPSRVLERLGMFAGRGLDGGLEKTERFIQRTVDEISSIIASIGIPDFGAMFNGGTYRAEFAFAGGYSMEMDDLRAEIRDLRSAIQSQPIQVNSRFDIDGRAVARGTAVYDREEANKLDKLSKNLGGIK